MGLSASRSDIRGLWRAAERAVLAAAKTVKPDERFLVGAGLPGGRRPGNWRVAVGKD
jgi:hypothetical protein